MNDILKAMKERRSIRKFKSDTPKAVKRKNNRVYWAE